MVYINNCKLFYYILKFKIIPIIIVVNVKKQRIRFLYYYLIIESILFVIKAFHYF
jgi:hypothetical protein